MIGWEKSKKLWIGVSERVARIDSGNLVAAENIPELRKNIDLQIQEASESQPSLGNKNTKPHDNESEEQQMQGKTFHEIIHR